MKKSIAAVIILLLAATSAFAATAFWTGRQEQVQTVTYQWAWKCEYNYNGQTFWRIFQTSCPSSIEVQ
jgi:heme/copper-type cytochrome/quinol oxidase subunit 2